MKRILITGKNSYVGTNVEKWLMREPDKYYVESISVRGEEWKSFDFSKFDVVFHVAGIAHLRENKKNINTYYRINNELALKIANKAKKESVKKFIFMSSMSVYGIEIGNITKDTIPKPNTAYGKSKLEAEENLFKLEDDNFKIVVIRPPMIYGKDSPGNYFKLSKLSKITPIFPQIINKRSMIYIDNLSEFVRQIINTNREGLFFPQNKEYLCTSEIVKVIASINKKHVFFTRLFNVVILKINFKIFRKLFFDLTYDTELSKINENYSIVDFKESIFFSEGKYVK